MQTRCGFGRRRRPHRKRPLLPHCMLFLEMRPMFMIILYFVGMIRCACNQSERKERCSKDPRRRIQHPRPLARVLRILAHTGTATK